MSWGLELSKSGGQFDAHVHQEVAAPNLHLNKKSIPPWLLEHVFIHGRQS
jgi:hypothetical protein